MEKQYKLSPKEYSTILEGIDLISISLQKSQAYLNPGLKIPNDLKINIEEDASFTKRQEKIVELYQTYKVDARKPDSKSRYIQLSITLNVKVRSEKEFNEDFFEIYKDISLHLNTWPYLREFVNQATARMNVPPLTIPF